MCDYICHTYIDLYIDLYVCWDAYRLGELPPTHATRQVQLRMLTEPQEEQENLVKLTN